MHSFQPSRGRVFFEALCALGMSVSFAGAWMQTHATALLGAAGIAALYGLVHLFDMRRPKLAVAAEPQRIDFAPEAPDIVVPMAIAEEQPEADEHAELVEVVEQAAPRAGPGRRTGGSRKGGGRRAKAPKAVKAVVPALPEEADAPWPMAEEADLSEPAAVADEEFVFSADDESAQPHIAPLFEPEPFVRMPRQAFGRRGRI
jgi:hypothetical protein